MATCDRCKDDLSELDYVLCDECKEKDYLDDIKQARLSALQECREIAEASVELNKSRQDDAEGKELFDPQFNLVDLYLHKASSSEDIQSEIQSLIDKEGRE